MKKYMTIKMAIFLFMATVLMIGCAGFDKYGKLRSQSRDRPRLTIEQLTSTWHDYKIYYAGYDSGRPLGIVFDPKNDSRNVTGKRWSKVEDQMTLEKLIGWIRFPASLNPQLYRILDTDNHLYGYMYTAMQFPKMKKIDEQTMYLYDLTDSDIFFQHSFRSD